MSNSSNSSGGITLGGLIFAIFLTLKLLKIEPVADWSWWWVTAPLWGGLVLIGAILAIVAVFYWIADSF